MTTRNPESPEEIILDAGDLAEWHLRLLEGKNPRR
jgi:hypothetical protein